MKGGANSTRTVWTSPPPLLPPHPLRRYEKRLLAAADDKRLALERQLISLTGSAEEIAAAKAAQEKEARVELYRRQVLKRVMNSGISRGWSAWAEYVASKTYAMNRLLDIGNRLHKPNLSGAFYQWALQAQGLKQVSHSPLFPSKPCHLAIPPFFLLRRCSSR